MNEHRRRLHVNTYRHVSSLAREIRSGLQRTLEAGHRPLTVSGGPCAGFVQRQIPDTAGEATRAWSLKFTNKTTTQAENNS